MRMVFIPKRMSNTGSSHSLASEHFARGIKFKKGCIYAFVNVAFYGGYKTFKTAEAAAKYASRCKTEGRIIDCNGNLYFSVNNFELMLDESAVYKVFE